MPSPHQPCAPWRVTGNIRIRKTFFFGRDVMQLEEKLATGYLNRDGTVDQYLSYRWRDVRNRDLYALDYAVRAKQAVGRG